ncbi:ring-1,2-phenylacetyl-CoA epoxidase subunit PaaD [Kytococcus aerolatus]|uniref:Ring-1,2-phenylacetyl-CoA epoxidase subunit PaaD n=1 Tax=Kytococcus aerolatus TaxID=592308 RepID=A0A212U0E8_9MICO|nr:1,2-phenylacetyl-CoA epoxidase subunit PaaD [Kytococcus aerolatus]SNC71723.1 ring-1,2-phenylacetyl-CoA epoxidase subunit PaaD [Kytococcus aerolatus]
MTSAPERAPLAEVLRALGEIPDPEIPVITLEDLGVLRSVTPDEEHGRIHVEITPTYSGCPAMEVMEGQVARVIALRGWEPVVERRLDPPWTTDWMSEAGKEKLRAFGIAPPGPAAPGQHDGTVGLSLSVRQVDCPSCGSSDTEELARFGSTACKALRRCRACLEPFDEFKPL